jgi:hypothetical protein
MLLIIGSSHTYQLVYYQSGSALKEQQQCRAVAMAIQPKPISSGQGKLGTYQKLRQLAAAQL